MSPTCSNLLLRDWSHIDARSVLHEKFAGPDGNRHRLAYMLDTRIIVDPMLTLPARFEGVVEGILFVRSFIQFNSI